METSSNHPVTGGSGALPNADYILGTHDEEVARLGLQHRVWRSAVLDAWTRAGLTIGSRMADFGAGPGYATFDAAEIVGPTGEVVAIERSDRFVAFARAECERRGFSHVRFLQADLMGAAAGIEGFDLAWCRWVASFVTSPQRLVEQMAGALRPGGRAVFHEYAHYATWRATPPGPAMGEFVTEVMASWRSSGGEPDVALALVPWLRPAGLQVLTVKPILFTVRPGDYGWQWPASFIETNLRRLVELGRTKEEWANRVRAEFQALEQNADALLLTPLLLEIIAERV